MESRTVLAYVAGPITVELHVDRRDQVFEDLLGRSVNGKPPPGYSMHEGRRMRLVKARWRPRAGGE